MSQEIRKLILFDLDNTVCCCKHRKHFVQGKKRNFDAFNLACINDTPLPTLQIFKALFLTVPNLDVYLFSGRDSIARELTLEWFHKHTGIEPAVLDHYLRMRPLKDYRADQVVKKEMLDQLLAEYKQWDIPVEIVGVFDDRNKVIRMWQENGLFVFNCNQTGEEF